MYRWVEHTAEIELEIDAASEEDVYREALEAVAELLGAEDGGAGDTVERSVELASGDRARLLAAWLGELAYLAEADGLVPQAADGLRLGPGTLRAVVHGHVGDPPHLIKAVTYHRLEFEPDGGRWRARAILDV